MAGWATIYNISSGALQRYSADIARMQEQISSGKRVVHASDDPSDAHRLLGLRGEKASTDAYLESIGNTELGLNSVSSVLQDTNEALTRVAQLLTQASTSTYSDAQRNAIAMEVDELLEHVISLANHQVMDKHVFGGMLTREQPFEVVRENGQITDVIYRGNARPLEVPVGPGIMYDSTMVGSSVFGVDDRQGPQFTGTTGLTGGAGTSNLRGYAELEIVHTQTQYYDTVVGDLGGINLVPGASSATGDTVLGDGTHTVTLDADAGTARLDDGPAVAYSALTTDLQLTNDAGDVVYIDTSGVTLAAGQATVNVLSYGQATIDGGLSYVPVELNELTHGFAATSADGSEVLYVDASGAARVGTEPIRVPGTHDVFDVMIQMRDILLDAQDYTQAEKTQHFEGLQAALEEVTGSVTQGLTAVGSRLQALDLLEQRLTDLSIDYDAEASALGDADVVQLAIDLSKAENFYQTTLMSISRLFSLSLLDFLTT